MDGLTAAEYRALVEHSPVMIWRADVAARCDYFNATWLAFTGRTLAEEAGDGWAEGVHPDDRERCLASFRRSFAGRQTFEMEYRLRRHDGEYRWLFDRGAPLFDRGGAFGGYVGSCVDVHERRELDAAKARFLSLAAHELRTPLASLRTYLEVIARRAASGAIDPATITRAQGQLGRFTRLLGDLDDMATLELEAPLALQPARVELDGLVAEAVAAARARLAQAGDERHALVVTVEPAAAPGTFALVADPARLRQALSNLLDNAVKFSPDGGRIEVRLAAAGDAVAVTIADPGIGVPPAEVGRLGRRFFRASNAPAMNYPGLGLGLMLARAIVERHGGALAVSSALGRGTSVAITLPRAGGGSV